MPSDERSADRPALGADLIIPALALGFAVYFFFSIEGLAWEAKANGVLIGAVLVILVGVQLVRIGVRLARGEGSLRFDALLHPRDALGKRVGMMLLTVAFIATITWLGLTLALFLAMAAGLYLMGVRRPWSVFWVSFGVAASAYLLFIALLNSDLPHGPIENLIAALLQGRQG